jgi:hypothetical protein
LAVRYPSFNGAQEVEDREAPRRDSAHAQKNRPRQPRAIPFENATHQDYPVTMALHQRCNIHDPGLLRAALENARGAL